MSCSRTQHSTSGEAQNQIMAIRNVLLLLYINELVKSIFKAQRSVHIDTIRSE